MPDYTALSAEWQEMLARRHAMGESLALWTSVLDGWRDWKVPGIASLQWSAEECLERWQRGAPLLGEAAPAIEPESLEDLLGPLMERLAAAGPDDAESLQRFAEAWDASRIGPAALFPTSSKEGGSVLYDEVGMAAHIAGFLAHAGLRPALETFFSRVRVLPEGTWARGFCPWCGGLPSYGDLLEDRRRRLACRGYLKGVDRRERWNAVSPLVEDWASPHVDYYASREGYWRATPTLAQLLPSGEGAAG